GRLDRVVAELHARALDGAHAGRFDRCVAGRLDVDVGAFDGRVAVGLDVDRGRGDVELDRGRGRLPVEGVGLRGVALEEADGDEVAGGDLRRDAGDTPEHGHAGEAWKQVARR